MGYTAPLTAHQQTHEKYQKTNKRIHKNRKNLHKNQPKLIKRHKHFHYNRKHKKNCQYSPIYKISEPYKPIFFSDQHKPFIQEEETKWIWQGKNQSTQRQRQCDTSSVVEDQLRHGQSYKNRVNLEEKYKSYIDKKVIMKLLMCEQVNENQRRAIGSIEMDEPNQKLKWLGQPTINIRCEDDEKSQLLLMSQIQNKFQSININRMKEESE